MIFRSGLIHVMKDPVAFRKSAAYIRISTEEQNSDLQYQALEPFKSDITYTDIESGISTFRTAYNGLEKAIREGKIKLVMVYRLDRLGRDPIELIKFFDLLEEKGVKFFSITEPWLSEWNTGPAQFFSWWLQLGQARYELLLLKDRQRRGIQAKKEKIRSGKDTWKGRGKDRQPRRKNGV